LGLPLKFVDIFVLEKAVHYSKFVKAAEVCQFVSTAIDKLAPHLFLLFFQVSGLHFWHLNLPLTECNHVY
jgi:hypothetical protein